MRVVLPGTSARLTFVRELDRTGMSAVFWWKLTDQGRARDVRIYASDMLINVLQPRPSSQDEWRRAFAQLAAQELRESMAEDDFFEHDAERDVKLTSHGPTTWDPAATPAEAE
jgi:hypothetical protein